MECSLLCNEVWLMSPNSVQENDGFNANDHLATSFFQDCEEAFGIFLDKETRFMPESGYLKLVQTNYLILNARLKAVTWFIKSRRRMNLSLGTVFIAANYLDRFISLTTQCRDWKNWMLELVSIACLSVASKFNETITPTLQEIQMEGLDHCFAPGLIQRMELTLLKGLSWRMDSTTPYSYVHLLIQCIDTSNQTLVEDLYERVAELLLITLLDPKFLEFHPCVIAMSAFRCISDEIFPPNNASLAHLETVIPQDHKDDLIECKRIMGKLMVEDQNMIVQGPSSPVTVLKVDFFNSDDFSAVKIPMGINMDLRSSTRKRKREELECGL
ncbi:G1/S-specific cyclin D [Handroanthus impetiginosus]|uniref:G1/S-specific cyclin D n=1 Tax=Handroanthus impetiginosus TaxID=429701 RepID=A0A2G9HHT7_9LAMI|nr:G1/S-specific cyclin D [Handroanthus impetiginosus]